jgi:hypothetical protein
MVNMRNSKLLQAQLSRTVPLDDKNDKNGNVKTRY